MSSLKRLENSTDVEKRLDDQSSDRLIDKQQTRYLDHRNLGHQSAERADGERPGARAPARKRVVPAAAWLGGVLAVLVLAAGFGARLVVDGFANLNPLKNGLFPQSTVDRSGPAVLKAITDMGTLRSASGYYEVVIDVEKNVEHVPSFLAGRRVLFVAAGTVDAGVDLKSVDAGAVTVDSARSAAVIRLPKPRLSQPSLNLDRSYVYSDERGIVNRIAGAFKGSPLEDQKKLYELASRRLAEAAAVNDELVSRAEVNAREVLQGLLRSLGFTDVTVTFAG